MAQGALGATGVRRVWAGAGLQRAAYRGGVILLGFSHSLLSCCSADAGLKHMRRIEFPNTENLSVTYAQVYIIITSCARGDTICLGPLQVNNIFAFIRQVASVQHIGYFKTSATR